MRLREVPQQTGLSGRWVRELVRRHGIPVRKVRCGGGGRYVLTRADVERIWCIHERNQGELQRRSPLFKAVGLILQDQALPSSRT